MDTDRLVAHVDMDAFYASVEQFDNPELRGRPVVVGGAGARGVVAAASYEVREFGVRSAMPASEARKRCPDAIFVRPRMQRYREVSGQIFSVFRQFTPQVEGLSLDEAYLDITHSRGLFASARALGQEIKARIARETGLTASVGIGPNKLVAKIACDLDKPDGLCVVPPARVQEVLDPLPVRVISGIGPKTAARLEKAGLHTIAQLRQAPEGSLAPVFGRYSVRMQRRAAGIDNRPVGRESIDKSISAEETFDTNIGDPAELRAQLAVMVDKVAARLRRTGLAASVVTVKVRTPDFNTVTRQRAFRPPGSDTRTILDVAASLLDQWCQENTGATVRLLGVGVSSLAPDQQLDLFAVAEPQGGLDEAVDSIRDRFGTTSVRRGSDLK
ncbi:MAG: DNA polymerase IV [Pseudomonadota bacterium]